jgi:AraC-like DNA-binding protein
MDRDSRFHSPESGPAMQSYFWDGTLAAEGECVTTIINAVRAQLAEEYLANSKRKLYEVAELLGFSTAGDFSRWFRSQFGKTPSDWAADYRKSKAAAGPVSHK